MMRKQLYRCLLGAAALATVAYAGFAGQAWLRFGKPQRGTRDEEDPILDLFIPEYDVVERHSVGVNAPAEVTFAAACDLNLEASGVARLIFKSRELLLGGEKRKDGALQRLVPATKAIGWRVLAEVSGREIVMGAVTQPWKANVVFRSIAPADFLAFQEPEYVKIVWTLRADPVSEATSTFRTETRVLACGPEARTKFRRYWAFLSPGIVIIRRVMLGPLKQDAERRSLAIAKSASQL